MGPVFLVVEGWTRAAAGVRKHGKPQAEISRDTHAQAYQGVVEGGDLLTAAAVGAVGVLENLSGEGGVSLQDVGQIFGAGIRIPGQFQDGQSHPVGRRQAAGGGQFRQYGLVGELQNESS